MVFKKQNRFIRKRQIRQPIRRAPPVHPAFRMFELQGRILDSLGKDAADLV